MSNDFFLNENYQEFIEDFENNWLQYASGDEKMKAYFGSEDKAISLFEKWKNGEDIWMWKRSVLWNLQKKSNRN